MNRYPSQGVPPLQVNVAEDYFERHVVDLEGLGYQLYNYLTGLLTDYPNSSDLVQFVYKESIAQMVLSMDFNYDEFCLRLIALPDLSMFKHIPAFDYPQVKEQFTVLFKEIALQLFTIVYNATNPMKVRAQYFADAVTLTYVIVVKSFEPAVMFPVVNL